MNKNNLLNQITVEQIYNKYCDKYITNKNISSPFSDDKKASFRFYKNGSFKCNSTGKQGDVFQFVGDLNSINPKSNFNDILKIIYTDFNITISNNQDKHFKVWHKDFTKEHLIYWENINVSKEYLTKYKVQAVDKFQFFNSNKNDIQLNKIYNNVLAFSYNVNDNFEIYIPEQPKVKAKKFFYNGLKSNDIFGLKQIKNKVDKLYIVAGKKDCLVLNANNINAVCFRSENHFPDQTIINILKLKCNHLFIIYDNDLPGQKAALKISNKYNIINCTIPQEFNDIANYSAKHNLDNFINELKLDKLKKQNNLKVVHNEPKKVIAESPLTVGTIFHQVENWLTNEYDIRYNEISLEIEIKLKHEKDFKQFNENTIWIKLQKGNVKIPMASLLAIIKSDYVQKYNPLKTYFKSLPKWDTKIDYIEQFCNYVTLKNEDLRKEYNYTFKKWLVRTVKGAVLDGYFNKQAFILSDDGNGQNIGKTSYVRFLVPKELDSYIAEDISNDKDARILLCKNFLINLDELAVLSKKEINHLKAYFSKTQINERLPYDRKNSIIPRVASFIGSTNKSTFLEDETGSVRWLVFTITNISWNYSKEFDINNLWKQAFYLAFYDDDFDETFNRDDIKRNEERNQQYTIMSAERELLYKHFAIPKDVDNQNVQFLTATEILVKLKTVSNLRLTSIGIGRALKANGFNRFKKAYYGYYVENIESDFSTSIPQIYPNANN